MGWSCAARASDTMRAWTDACVASTGCQNTFEADGDVYFWEVSRTEHADGAITGTIHRTLKVGEPLRNGAVVAEGQTFCRQVARFRIEPDGSVKRAPKFLKDAAKRLRVDTVGRAVGSGGAR